jgi:hypothetical protein
MKATQILYLVLIIALVAWALNSTHLLDSTKDGFEDLINASVSEPIIPKVLSVKKLPTEVVPNPLTPSELPYGPYAQMASVGSFQYKDPSLLPAELTQMKKLFEDLRSFLVFEGVNLAGSSDPNIQLPLTQLRADSRKIQQEVAVLDKNPGVQSQLTQQDLADIDGSLRFLQKKVRLFETSGLISDVVEGFQNTGQKTVASKNDLELLQTRAYSAILTLSASGTVDPVVQARIKALQTMYSNITDMLTRLNNGSWTEKDIPVYAEDIQFVLPGLANPQRGLMNIFSQPSGRKLNPIEQHLSNYVGEENASSVFDSIKDKGMFRVSVDLGYNVDSSNKSPSYKQNMELQSDGSIKMSSGLQPRIANSTHMDLPFDSHTPGMDDRAKANSSKAGFDWKKRTESICDQIKRRGLDPLDFGCIARGSLMSPAYSWRGHAKMVCGRLGATLDPDLPVTCGCPPQEWKGWTRSV